MQIILFATYGLFVIVLVLCSWSKFIGCCHGRRRHVAAEENGTRNDWDGELWSRYTYVCTYYVTEQIKYPYRQLIYLLYVLYLLFYLWQKLSAGEEGVIYELMSSGRKKELDNLRNNLFNKILNNFSLVRIHIQCISYMSWIYILQSPTLTH